MQGGCTNPNRNRLGGDLLLVDDADSSEQGSLKGALRLLAKLGKTGWVQELCQAADVELPRAHVDESLQSFSSKSATPPIGVGRGCLVARGRLGRGQLEEGATRVSLLMSQAGRSPSAKQSDVGRRTRTFTVQSGAALGRSGPGRGSETGPSALSCYY